MAAPWLMKSRTATSEAWKDFGRIGENGHYHIMMAQDTRAVRENVGKVAVGRCLAALLNMGKRDFVHDHYPRQIRDLLKPPRRRAVDQHHAAPACDRPALYVTDDCDFGWVTAWVSRGWDMRRTVNGLLTYADRYMAPRWRDGGLYFLCANDSMEDAGGTGC